jgi:hypothetical protein
MKAMRSHRASTVVSRTDPRRCYLGKLVVQAVLPLAGKRSPGRARAPLAFSDEADLGEIR